MWFLQYENQVLQLRRKFFLCFLSLFLNKIFFSRQLTTDYTLCLCNQGLILRRSKVMSSPHKKIKKEQKQKRKHALTSEFSPPSLSLSLSYTEKNSWFCTWSITLEFLQKSINLLKIWIHCQKEVFLFWMGWREGIKEWVSLVPFAQCTWNSLSPD